MLVEVLSCILTVFSLILTVKTKYEHEMESNSEKEDAKNFQKTEESLPKVEEEEEKQQTEVDLELE